jgi:hypothetical protein
MFCSTCGGAVARALTYCNHCGAKLAGAEEEKGLRRRSEQHSELLVWAVLGGLAVGLGGIIGLMAVMKEVVHFNMEWIIGFTILSFVLVIAAETVLISQLMRHQSRHRESSDPGGLPQPSTTKELNPTSVRMLPDPVPSVTEQTTRTFEPVYSERKSS